NLPLSFQPNVGQIGDPGVKFVVQSPAGRVALSRTGAVIAAADGEAGSEVVGMKLVGANPKPELRGVKPLPGITNWLIGNDRTKWRRIVRPFKQVRYASVYPGVDLLWHGTVSKLEYDFVVAPGADPRGIRLALEGADKVTLGTRGDLAIRIGQATLHQQAPVV